MFILLTIKGEIIVPRSARTISESNIYHIMFRGNELRDIFIDDEDRNKFLNTLLEKSKAENFSIYAYCLMDNHVHILLSGNHSNLGKLVKRINTSYVYYFNKKYDRLGHLFQDRYKSETVETIAYSLEAVRYIHNNPVKAGITRIPSDYKWSSYNCYIRPQHNNKFNIDIFYILEMFSGDEKKAVENFIKFSNEKDINLKFIDIVDVDKSDNKKNVKIKGEQAAEEFIKEYLKLKGLKIGCIGLKGYEKITKELIVVLKRDSSLSIRQIAKALKISRGKVQRVK